MQSDAVVLLDEARCEGWKRSSQTASTSATPKRQATSTQKLLERASGMKLVTSSQPSAAALAAVAVKSLTFGSVSTIGVKGWEEPSSALPKRRPFVAAASRSFYYAQLPSPEFCTRLGNERKYTIEGEANSHRLGAGNHTSWQGLLWLSHRPRSWRPQTMSPAQRRRTGRSTARVARNFHPFSNRTIAGRRASAAFP